MKYTKKDMGSYNLHMIKTNKYKTITVRVVFRRKIEKDEINLRDMLIDLMTYSCKKYNTRKKMTIKLQDLYSTYMSARNTRTGNFINTFFSMNVLNDKYTEEGNFKEALEFFNEMIFNPDVKDNKFKEKVLNITKNIYRANLSSIKEHPSTYATIRAIETFDNTSPISYRMDGYLDDIDKVTPENLYEYYQSMIKKDLIDIFVIGDINEDEIVKDIKSYFKLKVVKKQRIEYELDIKKPRSKKLIEKETIENTQSHLNVVCTVGKLTKYEKDCVLPIFNIIYGGGSDGKLFKIVREKHSLCYSIRSIYEKYDNVLQVKTAINRENYSKTLELIEKILNDMKKGKFTNSEIDIAKKLIDVSLDEIEESPSSVIDMYMSIAFNGLDDIETAREKIKKVTKGEIIKVAKKVNVDTVFMLEGDKDEEETD